MFMEVNIGRSKSNYLIDVLKKIRWGVIGGLYMMYLLSDKIII